MRVLALDPGAERTGWAALETGPRYIASGHEKYPRGIMPFQQYRLALTKEWTEKAHDLIEEYKPHYLVSETVPSRGAGIPEQLYLASVQISAVHTIAFAYGVRVQQVSARTVQKAIAVRGKSKGVTKPQVRNGVISLLPELQPRLKDWVKIFEEPDAIAIGLWYLGMC